MQPCSALLVRCAWLGHIYDCSKIFKTVKSKEGFCCAFNSHYYLNIEHKSDYTYNNSTDFNVTSEDLPGVQEILKAPGSGRDVGLAVALNVERDTYKATSRPYVGATIMIHDAIDFPDIGTQFASVPPGHVLAISVSGTSIKSAENLRNLPLEKRLCYFGDEIPGETYYSYQSCVSECVAKYTQSVCNCLPFYYPKMRKGMKTCYFPDIECLLNARKSTSKHVKSTGTVQGTCRECLPQCSDMLYHINVENIKMDDVGFDSDITHDLDVHNISFAYVFFGDVSYVEYRKESSISWDSLIASFGGIFGLCLGGSVISVIELIYLPIRQFFEKQRGKTRGQSLTALPPASKIFIPLSISEDKVWRQKLRRHKKCNDIFVINQPFMIQENGYFPIFSRTHQVLSQSCATR
ncbi:pickpocket protein 28-like [Linepithema humile]|uniref:pickpocket protein 28-like n=1 Tax=Linepithema humile TaxID=83485 RepID=UPI00351E1902